MRIVAEADVRQHVQEHGGAVYLWPKGTRGCCGRTFVLESATEPPTKKPGKAFELVHAADGFQIYTTPGLVAPDELHLELTKRGKIRAYWNGQAWIG